MGSRTSASSASQNRVDTEPLFRAAWRHVGGAVLKHQRCGGYGADRLEGRRWYCLSVKPGHDYLVAALLRHKRYLSLLPLYLNRAGNGSPIVDPLFPGYQFVAVDRRSESTAEIYAVNGVKGFVGCRSDDPRPVAPGLVESLLACIGPDGLYADRPWVDPVQPGVTLRVTAGPFEGVTGICEMSSGDRVRIFLALLGGAPVTIPRTHVTLEAAS